MKHIKTFQGIQKTAAELWHSEEKDYAKMVVGPLGLRVISGKIFIGKGECIPGGGINCEESDIHEGEGKYIPIENGLYQLYIYLIDWFNSPKYWNSDYKIPDKAPPDYVVLISKIENNFTALNEEPRLVSDDNEFLFESSTRLVGPIEGMELKTKVWRNKSALILKECGPLNYKPYFDDYTNVQWKDSVTIRVIEVNHDEKKMRCELVSINKP